MRLFTAVRHSADPRFFSGDLWSRNFYPALRALGHEIVESQVDLFAASRFLHIAKDFTAQELEARSRITEQIVAEVKEAHGRKPLDLFLSYFYNAHFDPSGFEEIHRLGIPTVNFYCNSISQFPQAAEISSKVRFAWHPEKNARPLYLKAGANPVWVPMGADPEVYRPIPNVCRQPKACFVGERYADRDRYLARLIQSQIPVDIFGVAWNALGRNGRASFYLGRKVLIPASLESYWKLVRRNFEELGMLKGFLRSAGQWQYRLESRKLDPILAQRAKGRAADVCRTFNEYEVVLNFSHVWADERPGSRLIPHLRLRDFEAPMCRTCYLTGRTDEIAEFYEIGKEIDTYRTPEELVSKSEFYLAHPSEAEKMREAGYKRARRDHTWTNRFRALFDLIGV